MLGGSARELCGGKASGPVHPGSSVLQRLGQAAHKGIQTSTQRQQSNIATFLVPWHYCTVLLCIRPVASRDLYFQNIAHDFMDRFITDIAVKLGAYPEMNLSITAKVAGNFQMIF